MDEDTLVQVHVEAQVSSYVATPVAAAASAHSCAFSKRATGPSEASGIPGIPVRRTLGQICSFKESELYCRNFCGGSNVPEMKYSM